MSQIAIEKIEGGTTADSILRGEIDYMAERIRRRFEPLGGVELDIPPRTGDRPLVDFSGPEFGAYDEES